MILGKILTYPLERAKMSPQKKYRLFLSVFLLLLFLLPDFSWAQAPSPAYYYHQATELPWAECIAYMEGGSRQKIAFLPVVSSRFRIAPLGIGNYSQDVNVDGPVVFIGNGIFKENVWNSYKGRKRTYGTGDIDVSDKIVMFCYDFPDKIEEQFKKEFPLTKRISEAASRKAKAVVLFSFEEEYPFLYARYEKESELPDIPVITIHKSSAINILLMDIDAGGDSLFKKWMESSQPPQSVELSSRMRLKIKGNFEKAETRNFLFRFRKEVFSGDEMTKLAQVNEKSVLFLLKSFKENKTLFWKRLLTVYFRDFDSKYFYTHHMGMGKAADEGVFLIHKGGIPDFGLAVHENTHILAYLNWGGSTSFLDEGLGKYAEALATDKEKNNLQTINFLKENNLFPLEEMVTFSIGAGGLKTQVGYPASGSFVGFLIETYGLNLFKEVYRLEGRPQEEKKKDNCWQKAYGKSLQELEKGWLTFLAQRYKLDEKFILNHLQKISQEKKQIELDPKILDSYQGQYQLTSEMVITISREDNHLVAEVRGMGKLTLYAESETKFSVKEIEATVTFAKDDKGEVKELIFHTSGPDMSARKIK